VLDYSLDELLADLKKYEDFIDGVVVSGGEPTIDMGLPAFLSLPKERNYRSI
jgi:pyruvate formate lyase activating enzyme